MLGPFCLRLACGILWMLAPLSSKHVGSGFFQSRLHLVLGLTSLGALAGFPDSAEPQTVRGITIVAAVGSFISSAMWGLERVRAARALLLLLAGLTTAGVLLSPDVRVSGLAPEVWLARLAPLSSALCMGAILVAMLMGHRYLTAPTMSLEPLRRLLVALGVAVGARGLLAGAALGMGQSSVGLSSAELSTGLMGALLALRVLAGLIGPLVVAVLAWQTVKIRSTQSATGILYAGVVLVLLGELSATLLARATGIPI